MRRSLFLLLALAALTSAPAAAEKKEPAAFTAEQVAFYEKQVLPILKADCYKCHAGKKRTRRPEPRQPRRSAQGRRPRPRPSI